MGYFNDLDYCNKSAHPADRVPANDDTERAADGDDLAGVVQSNGDVNEVTHVVEVSEAGIRMMKLAVDAYNADSHAAEPKHVSGWGWRKARLVAVTEELQGLGFCEVMYTGTGNVWYRVLPFGMEVYNNTYPPASRVSSGGAL